MIIFYADAGWSLNLTNLKIKFVEENAFFSGAFYKNYTLPFGVPVDDETSIKLGLIDDENISSYEVKHRGKLFIDTYFEESELLIEVDNQQLEGSLFFGELNNPILERSLKSLPFPTIKTGGILSYAQAQISKGWPDASCNFPMVYDDEFHNETNYEHFEGIVNQHNGTAFKNNSLNGSVPENKNIMVPFPYLMEVLKVGFATAGLEMIGDFVNKKENHHIIIDPENHLERFNSLTTADFEFTEPTDEYYDGPQLIQEFTHTFTLNAQGSFNVKAYLNFPKTITVQSFKIVQGGTDGTDSFADKTIFESTSTTVNESITINKELISGNVTVTFILKMFASTINVSDFNAFSYDKSEGKLNVFQSDFSLAEFMPDITFGKLLEKVKNKFNLKVTPQTTYVVIDYVESKFLEVDFATETQFEINQPIRKFNQSKVYKLISATETDILIDKNGLVSSDVNIREEDITEIAPGLDRMTIEDRNDIFTALRNPDSELAFLLYDGVNGSGYPIAKESINDHTFSLQEIYDLYWKKWLYFRCNSETYIDTFTAHSLDKFNINIGKFKYNKKHLVKRITKTRISEEHYKHEVETETF